MIEFSVLLKFDVEGAGAVETVDKIFSRDVIKLADGRIAYGVVVTDEGKMVDDITVFLHGRNHVRVIGANYQVGEYLNEHARPGVTITERRSEFAQLSLQGPKSRTILQRLTKTDVSNAALAYYSFRSDIEVAGVRAQVNRLGFTGELGYEIIVPVAKAGQLWSALQDAGRSDGLLPVGGAGLMTARLEAGLIMGGLDYGDDTTPFECRMGWAVDLDKGPFQGKSALQKLKHNERTKLVSVAFSRSDGDFSGCRLLHNGADAGVVPIVVPSPHLGGKLFGMATVTAPAAIVGTKLAIDQHPGVVAEIVKMPVYEADRIRVRS